MENLTIALPKIQIDSAIKELIQHQTERCTIVHCRVFTIYPTAVRIWPQTFLIEEDCKRRKLIKAFNISLEPFWTQHDTSNDFIRFTLVFEGLGRNCGSFHLLEDISELNRFYSDKALRNNSDVYEIEVFP